MMSTLTRWQPRRQSSYAAIFLVTVSGTLMVAAGHTLSSTGWTNARTFAFAGGLAIQVAFLVERRAARRNHPSAPFRRRWGTQLAASAFIAAAGAMLVAGGYAATSHAWGPTVAAAVPATIAVTIALRYNRRAVQAQDELVRPSLTPQDQQHQKLPLA